MFKRLPAKTLMHASCKPELMYGPRAVANISFYRKETRQNKGAAEDRTVSMFEAETRLHKAFILVCIT